MLPYSEKVRSNIRRFMEEKNITYATLGKRMGYADSTSVYKKVNGKYEINLSDIPRFADALGVTINEINNMAD